MLSPIRGPPRQTQSAEIAALKKALRGKETEAAGLRADVAHLEQRLVAASRASALSPPPPAGSPRDALRVRRSMARGEKERKALQSALDEALDKVRVLEARVGAFDRAAERARESAEEAVESNIAAVDAVLARKESEVSRWKRRHAALQVQYDDLRVGHERTVRKGEAQIAVLLQEIKVLRNKYGHLEERLKEEVAKKQPSASKTMLLLHEKAAHWLEKYRVLKIQHEAAVSDLEELRSEHKDALVNLRYARDKLYRSHNDGEGAEPAAAADADAAAAAAVVVAGDPVQMLEDSVSSLEERALVNPEEAMAMMEAIGQVVKLVQELQQKVDTLSAASSESREAEVDRETQVLEQLRALQVHVTRVESSAQQLRSEVLYWKGEYRRGLAKISKYEALLRDAAA